MIYEALDISKYIVTKCIAKNKPISNLQLQKILYFIQKDFLKRDTRAFSDEIEAWQFGPVVPNVYYHYCGFGAMPITFSINKFDIKEINENDRKYIDLIVKEKQILNPWTLVAQTHKVGGAWEKVFANGAGNHSIIPIDLIKEEA